MVYMNYCLMMFLYGFWSMGVFCSVVRIFNQSELFIYIYKSFISSESLFFVLVSIVSAVENERKINFVTVIWRNFFNGATVLLITPFSADSLERCFKFRFFKALNPCCLQNLTHLQVSYMWQCAMYTVDEGS